MRVPRPPRGRSGWWEHHGPRLPSHGIRARSQRGAFAHQWWAGRWIAALERLVDPGRLARGRSYARSGQVQKLETRAGSVEASVLGSRPRPYAVQLHFRALTDEEWERVLEQMAASALYAARLLSGEMPEEIEDVFRAAGVSLFPAGAGDMQTACSCPDWSNPCKHIAAVHYLLGERFDEDPFLMFSLRGRDREAIVAELRRRRLGGEAGAAEGPAAAEEEPEPPPDPHAFWRAPEPRDIALHFAAPEQDALAIKRLGPPPFVRDQRKFLAAMEARYRAISHHALEIALGDADAAGEVDGDAAGLEPEP